MRATVGVIHGQRPWLPCPREGQRTSSGEGGCLRSTRGIRTDPRHRRQPPALDHLRFRQALPPSSAPRLRQIRERTLGDFESLELSVQLRPRGRGESVARPGDVDQPVAFVVAEDQSVEGSGAARVAADHEFLATVHAHLHPCAAAQTGFVDAGAPLRDQPFQTVRLDRLHEDRKVGVERSGIPHWFHQLGKHLLLEPLPPRLQRLAPDILAGTHHHIEDVVHDCRR